MNERSHDEQSPLSFADARRLLLLILLIVVACLLLRALVPVVLLFAIVLLLAMVLNPIVVWLERRRIPRAVSIAVLLLGVLAIAVVLGAIVVPAVADQVQALWHRAPEVWQGIRSRLNEIGRRYPSLQTAIPQADQIIGTIAAQTGPMANVLVRSTIGVVGGVFAFVFALLLLIFILAKPQPLVVAYLALAPDRHREKARRTLVRLMAQVTAWARGVAINGAITGTTTGVLLWLIGVQPAFLFGVLGFLGEFLPDVGPVLVSIPILIVALSISATKFWLALGVLLFVYQIEVNFLVPFVLGKQMRMNPVSILFFTVTMAFLFGVAGAVLAVPAAALVEILIDEFYLRPRRVNYAALSAEADAVVRGTSPADSTQD